MAITVTHSKVSTIPDGDDSSLIRPSDWNDDHVLTGTIPVENGGTGASTLTGYVKGNGTSAMTAASTIPSTDITGLGTMASQNANNVTITGGSISGATVSGYIPTSEKAQPLGVATLDAGGKVPTSQIPMQGDLNYQGAWNANTNTPTLTSSTGTQGYYYVVSVAGTTNLDGITDWQVGDWAIFNGSVWQKVDNTDAVTSVNGLVGTVVLTTTNIAEGTNEYFTTARARASLSAGTGISYDSSTGVITNSSPSLGGDVVGPSSATDNAIARFDTTTGKLIQNSVVTIDDAGNIIGNDSLQFSGTPPVTQPIGTLWYDGTTETLNFQQNNITQQIGEELFVYGKASSAITDSPLQIIYKTGTVGASGNITFAPTVAGLTNDDVIIGVATENIALNATGRITCFGVVHNITTNGTAYGETWADGDTIWYNPVTGNPTKTKPTAPNVKCQIGTVINAGSGGSGSFQVEIIHGTSLGGTDSNVNITSPTAAQILTYDTTDAYWKNTSLASGTGISTSTNANGTLTVNNTGVTSAIAGTGISVSGATGAVTVTNTAPDQTVAIASGTGISVTGTYPNFTVTNTAPSSGGTVTSVAALTLGTTGTDLSSTVANSTTTPVITLNVPTASASNRGALSSTDWSTFNGKQAALVSGTNIKTVNGSSLLGSGDVGTIDVAHGGTGATSATAYAVLCGGTTSTGAHQSIASVGTTGQVLTSNGAGALPTFQTPSGGFPSGTAMLFVQTSAPTGWTKSTTHDNKALRVVSGTASSGGSVAFTTAFASQTPAGSVSTSITGVSGSVSTSISAISGSVGVSGTVGSTTLAESQIPSHRHTTTPYAPGGAAAYVASSYNSFFDGASGVSGYTGGSGSHNHSFSGSGSFTFSSGSASSAFTFSSGTASSSFTGTAINLAVQYVDVIIATKD